MLAWDGWLFLVWSESQTLRHALVESWPWSLAYTTGGYVGVIKFPTEWTVQVRETLHLISYRCWISLENVKDYFQKYFSKNWKSHKILFSSRLSRKLKIFSFYFSNQVFAKLILFFHLFYIYFNNYEVSYNFWHWWR